MRRGVVVGLFVCVAVACHSGGSDGSADAGDDSCACGQGWGIAYWCNYKTCFDNPCAAMNCVNCSGGILVNGWCWSQGEIDCKNAGGDCEEAIGPGGDGWCPGEADPRIACNPIASDTTTAEVCCNPSYDAGKRQD